MDADEGRYEGNFREHKMHGHGVMEFADGTRYEGQWRDGIPDSDGPGVYLEKREEED